MPGVPPDALDKLKGAFKGLFRRNKKSTTATSASTPGSAAPPAQQAAPPTAASEAAPPQLPPIENASPIHSVNAPDADVNKPLPPTHPLATGQRERPQQAIPVNEEANPGPPPPIVGPAETTERVQEPQKGAESANTATTVSPLTQPSSAPADSSQPSSAQPVSGVDGTSGDVSAATDEASPREEVKTDSAVQGVDTEEAAAPNKENIPPNPTTSATTASPTDDKATPNGTAAPAPLSTSTPAGADEGTPASPEEKVALVNEAPPPIKSSKPAPGMSATSGPLEDFPEGGDMRDPQL